jgi:hypothetical protein
MCTMNQVADALCMQVILADKYLPYEVTYEDCHVFNPGGFAGTDYTWSVCKFERRFSSLEGWEAELWLLLQIILGNASLSRVNSGSNWSCSQGSWRNPCCCISQEQSFQLSVIRFMHQAPNRGQRLKTSLHL